MEEFRYGIRKVWDLIFCLDSSSPPLTNSILTNYCKKNHAKLFPPQERLPSAVENVEIFYENSLTKLIFGHIL